MDSVLYFLIPVTIVFFAILFFFALKKLNTKLNSDLANQKKPIETKSVQEVDKLKLELKNLLSLYEELATTTRKHELEIKKLNHSPLLEQLTNAILKGVSNARKREFSASQQLEYRNAIKSNRIEVPAKKSPLYNN